MFAKVPRFAAAQDSGVPGPAAYTILSPENRKKGAFLDKDKRFKDVQSNGVELAPANDNEMAPNKLKTITNTNANEIAKHRLEAQRIQLTSEHAKEIKLLEQQIAKQTRKIAELQAAQTELDKLKKDSKTSARREHALQSDLEKVKEQLALLPGLRQKFDNLVAEHASSKTRHADTIDSYKTQISSLEKKVKTAQEAEAKLGAEGIAKTREVGRLGDELGRLRASKGDVEQKLKEKERECEEQSIKYDHLESILKDQKLRYSELEKASRKQSSVISAHASAHVEDLQQKHLSTQSRLQLDNLAADFRITRLERKLLEKEDQVAQLIELIMCLEEEKEILQERNEELEEDLEEMSNTLKIDNARHDHAQKYYQGMIEDEHESHDALIELYESAQIEGQLERDYYAACMKEGQHNAQAYEKAARAVEEMCLEKYTLEREHALLTEEMQAAQDLLGEQAAEMEDKQAHFEALQTDHAQTQERLDSTLAAKKAQEAELREQREQSLNLETALQAAQATETHLNAQIESLTNELVDYASLQETHEELLKALDRLMRTADLAEEDVNQLAQLNAQLIGHNNPGQRIRHMDRLRNELACLKKQHIATQSDLSSANRQIEALRSEISAYKAVGGVSVKHLQASRAAGPPRHPLAASIAKQTVARDSHTLQAPANALKHVGRGSLADLR